MEPTTRDLSKWLELVKDGSLRLPRFQRGEEWEIDNVERLVTSVIQGLPIGALLIFQVAGDPPFKCRPLHTVPEGHEAVKELLLDGQQRLTALWRSLHDNYANHTFLISLEDGGEDDTPAVIAIKRWRKSSDGTIKLFPLWVDNPTDCWQRKKIPLRLINPLDDDHPIDTWCENAVGGDTKQAWELSKQIRELRSQVKNYRIPALVLDHQTPPELAIKVFIQMNTNYVRLTAFDIVTAQIEDVLGESLSEKVNQLIRQYDRLRDFTADPGTFLLGVMALLKNQPANERGYFNLVRLLKNNDNIENEWRSVERGTKYLLSLLDGENIINSQVLPTTAVLVPIAALGAEVPHESDVGGAVRTLLRRYLWHSFFSARYDRALSTNVLEDYRALKRTIFEDTDPEKVPCFGEELPSTEDLMEAPWPRRRHRLARAILCLSLRGGAQDIADASPINPSNFIKREYHHIFPRSWLETVGGNSHDADRALNCMLLTWKSNREISAKEPLEYLKDRVDRATLGEKEIRDRLKTHSLDYDLIAGNDYARFLQERSRQCHEAMMALCRGEDWRPS